MTRRRPFAALLLVLFALALVAVPAWARVGGGGGYSGGGGSSGGGGGGGGDFDGLVELVFWLVLRHPKIGIPILILVIVVAVASKGRAFTSSARSSTTVFTPAYRSIPPPARSTDLSGIRAGDPNFSEPLFVDFAQLAYVRGLEARGSGNAAFLRGVFADDAVKTLLSRREGIVAIRDVIFGATRIASAQLEGGSVWIEVDFETNLTEVRGGAESQLLCRERWAFRRKAGVLSPGPERMRALGCAACGSALEPTPQGGCPSCGGARTGGVTQWEVARILVADRRKLTAPELATGGGIEPGTERATVVDPRLGAKRREFDARHPEHDWSAFAGRIRDTFVRLQSAWSERTWEKARALESDALFQSHRFWMDRYARFGLVNRIEDVSVGRIEIVKVDADAFFETVTARIFATMRDWTEDASGKIVGGSRDEPRSFSEYWTFLRTIGGKKPRGEWDPASCPSCGAPADRINMAGICEYCGGKLGGGDFDWVVSRIEQDDAY